MKRPSRSTVPPAEVLERRYRRLFACYPVSYRATNEDEMLGVAMSGTKPGQRWPARGEIRSLILGGARTRLGGLLSEARTPAWRDGCAAFSFLAAALLAVMSIEALTVRPLPVLWGTARVVDSGDPTARLSLLLGADGRLTASTVIPAVIWLLAAVAAAMGWRRVTAASASAGAVTAAVELSAKYTSDPSAVVAAWWQFVLAVTAAVAAVTWLAGPGGNGRRQRLSRRAMAAVATAGAVVAAAPVVQAAFTTVSNMGSGLVVVNPLFSISRLLSDALVALLVATLLLTVARLGPEIRRRVLLLSVPALAAGALVHWLLASSPWFAQPARLTAPQWAALTAVPVLGLVAGMIWLGRHERMLRRLAARPGDAPLSGSAA